VFGCSAGGCLTAQFTVAALKSGLEAPGAIGMFGAGAQTTPRGDLSFLSAVGCAEAPDAGGDLPPRSPFGYFSTAKPDDPVAYPLSAGGAYLGRFPPTIILTGTRAFDANAALATHRALSRAGVDASLQLFDGMRHCFIYHVDNPESRDAHTMIVRFFDRHLGV
jgi:acetyl esterase/lipase